MEGILGRKDLGEISAVGFLKERAAIREPGRSVLKPDELYELLLKSLGTDAVDALISVFYNIGEEEMSQGASFINERSWRIPRHILVILAFDLFMVLSDRDPGITPTKILDLSLRRTRLSRALSQIFGWKDIRADAIESPQEIGDGDVLLLVSLCFDPSRLGSLVDCLPPIDVDFTICEYIAAVIGPPPGRRPQSVCCFSPEAQALVETA